MFRVTKVGIVLCVRLYLEVMGWLYRSAASDPEQAPGSAESLCCSRSLAGFTIFRSVCATRTATDLTVNYPRCHLALARISGSLPIEGPTDIAALHKFARDNMYKADNNL